MSRLRRRQLIGLLGGVAVWPLAARAQQPAMPVVGFLSARSLHSDAHLVTAFRRGLSETGYVEGQNVLIEYRWAEGKSGVVPELASDLMRRQVAVMFAGGGDAEVRLAMAQSSGIPIVFAVGGDPVEQGLVASLNRPGGHATGVTVMTAELWPKRLELLRDLGFLTAALALFISPSHPSAELIAKEVQASAHARGQQVRVFRITAESELDAAFTALVQQGIGALLVMNAPLFFSRRQQLVAMASRHRMPTIYDRREFAAAGGLISYGASVTDQYYQSGRYVGRVLRGAKPAELPVLQPVKFEMVINLKTAAALGLDVPPTLLARADEVIE